MAAEPTHLKAFLKNIICSSNHHCCFVFLSLICVLEAAVAVVLFLLLFWRVFVLFDCGSFENVWNKCLVSDYV